MRDLLAFKLGYRESDDESPLLASGWREQLVGSLVDDLLAGRASLRICDINSPDPLVVDRP